MRRWQDRRQLRWTPREIAILTELAPTTRAVDIAIKLRRPFSGLLDKARQLGIKVK